MTQTEAVAKIRKIGARVRFITETREFRVNIPGGSEQTAYYTNDPQDAVNTALAMIQRANPGFHGKSYDYHSKDRDKNHCSCHCKSEFKASHFECTGVLSSGSPCQCPCHYSPEDFQKLIIEPRAFERERFDGGMV